MSNHKLHAVCRNFGQTICTTQHSKKRCVGWNIHYWIWILCHGHRNFDGIYVEVWLLYKTIKFRVYSQSSLQLNEYCDIWHMVNKQYAPLNIVINVVWAYYCVAWCMSNKPIKVLYNIIRALKYDIWSKFQQIICHISEFWLWCK